MNNPIMALAQMAMNRISSDPSFQKNPQARAFMDIMQRGDVAQGQQMAVIASALLLAIFSVALIPPVLSASLTASIAVSALLAMISLPR